MPEQKKIVRLAKAAGEFNVSLATIVEHLTSKGFEVDSKPSTKLSPEMYEALLVEFSSDVAIKERAEQVSIGTAKRENIEIDPSEAAPKKREDQETVLIKNMGVEDEVVEAKKEEEVEQVKVNLEGPKVLGKVDLKEEPKKKAEPKKEKAEPKKEEKVEAKEEPKKEVVEEKPEEKEDFIETKKVSLDGPKVIDKINLPTPEETSEQKKRKRKRIITGKVSVQKGRGNQGETTRKRRRVKKDEAGEPISKQEIEEKIKETMAKIHSTKGKSDRQKIRRKKRDEHADKKQAIEEQSEEQSNQLQVTEFISVNELASLMDKQVTDLITKCMELGVMVSMNQRLDAEIIELVTGEFGFEVNFIDVDAETVEEEVEEADDPNDLETRAPIVTIMGHVDHGKTSLLDYIRSTNVVAGESGGITQHIGAYEVALEDGRKVAFLDTPGHEAFTAMRARGAKVTDVAIIIVAADDAIMPQTEEAISHAQAAGVPMVFAINKVDKDGANPEKIKEQLANMNILVEDWGGKFQCQEISAKTGLGIDELLEKILLEAEMLELKANPDKLSNGTVIEASLDKGRGYVATLLVQDGSMHIGDIIVAGNYYGKVKAMFNERGQAMTEAGPSTPVQILGLDGAPAAGDNFKGYESEQEAKQIANKRSQITREQGFRTQKHITLDEIGRRLALGSFKELKVIIKGDVDGSVQALTDSLQKLSTDEIAVSVILTGVGQISESDVLLATASDAIIIGFNVRPSVEARRKAEEESIDIRLYSVIYKAIEEVQSAMEGMLEPDIEEKILFNAEILETFKITKIGTIAGCRVVDGKAVRNARVRVVRDGIVVYTGELDSLKRFKDDVKEVPNGQECGMSIKGFNDLKVGDMLEGFTEVSVKRTL